MRIIVPVVAGIIGIVCALAIMNRAADRTERYDDPVDQAVASQAEPLEQQVQAPTPTTAPSADPATVAAPGPAVAVATHPQALAEVRDLPELRVVAPAQVQPLVIGSVRPESGYNMQVQITPYGAGIWDLQLSHYHERVDKPDPYTIFASPRNRLQQPLYYAFAAQRIVINNRSLPLVAEAWTTSGAQNVADGMAVLFTLPIVTDDGAPLITVERRYLLERGSYDLKIEQRIVNHTDWPLNIVWEQNLQGDLEAEDTSYLGDRRRYITGYLDPVYDGGRPVRVYTDKGLWARYQVLKAPTLWPNSSLPTGAEFFWLASENRYFAIVTHRPVPAGATRVAEIQPLGKLFPRLHHQVMPSFLEVERMPEDRRSLVFIAGTDTLGLPPRGTLDLSLGAYVGPAEKQLFAQPPYSILGLGELIYYSLGGPCAFFTFQWLARFLLTFLTFIHGIIGDWGIAIIILVAVVRLILHPITKKAQVNMFRLQKQMAALQPEMEKLRKKYADDKNKLNAEMMKLYREKGVNPANMLGCLPMFLQLPIWLALYSMLYFAIELRHQPAFYNVFHRIGETLGFNWQFLTDLSSPDHFITLFSEPQVVSLYFIVFDYSAINILPLLMGVVFYFQNKMMAPPAANEQMAQQQKIMRVMMLLFPFFLYSAPSGLTLYICTSTAAGILDSWLVRRHVRKQEEAGTLFTKKPAKTGGFFDRLAKQIEAQQEKSGGAEKGSSKKDRR